MVSEQFIVHISDKDVGLLNLLSSDVISGVKKVIKASAAGALSQTPLGELTALLQTLLLD